VISRYVTLSLRAAAFIGVAGVVVVNARAYLFSQWGFSVSPTAYGVGAFFLIWLVFWFSTKEIISMLKTDALARQSRVSSSIPITEKSIPEGQYKYPLRFVCLLVLFGVAIAFIPIMILAAGDAIAPLGYLFFFAPACIPVIFAIYISRYSVIITSDKLMIRTIAMREVSLGDIAKASVTTIRGGRQAVVLLKDGRIIRFSGMLVGFNELLGKLTVKAEKMN
jgi:hypothetical protein